MFKFKSSSLKNVCCLPTLLTVTVGSLFLSAQRQSYLWPFQWLISWALQLECLGVLMCPRTRCISDCHATSGWGHFTEGLTIPRLQDHGLPQWFLHWTLGKNTWKFCCIWRNIIERIMFFPAPLFFSNTRMNTVILTHKMAVYLRSDIYLMIKMKQSKNLFK